MATATKQQRKVRERLAVVYGRRIVEEVGRHPDGIRAGELAGIIGLELKHVTRLLISLRAHGRVWGIIPPGGAEKDGRRWTTIPPEERAEPPTPEEEKPFPYYELNHQQWLRREPKPIFNPWSRNV